MSFSLTLADIGSGYENDVLEKFSSLVTSPILILGKLRKSVSREKLQILSNSRILRSSILKRAALSLGNRNIFFQYRIGGSGKHGSHNLSDRESRVLFLSCVSKMY